MPLDPLDLAAFVFSAFGCVGARQTVIGVAGGGWYPVLGAANGERSIRVS